MSSEEYKAKLREMYEPCLARADLKDFTEVVSLEWLLEMANPEPTETTDLGVEKPGILVGMAELAKDLKKRGLREPLVVGVGLGSGRARLEAGNHRVRVLLEMGFLHAPAVCWVGQSHVGFEGNGLHQGRSVKFWPQSKPMIALGPYDERYFEKPSALLPCAPIFSLDSASRGAKPRSASIPAAKEEAKKTQKPTKPKSEDPKPAQSDDASRD